MNISYMKSVPLGHARLMMSATESKEAPVQPTSTPLRMIVGYD